MATFGVAEVRDVLDRGHGCVPLLASHFNGKRGGLIATSVQLCGDSPPLVCIAIRKGYNVDLFMRDSRTFAVSFIPAADRVLIRRLGVLYTPDSTTDPFDGVAFERLISGAPVLQRCAAALDCQVFRQMDLETDHQLIIGTVLGLRLSTPA
jgi:flavin reductase (DIM6/NTAB) family NADH-FMN oxidoreductase RutF